jgi:hypothetical protein
MRFLLLGIGLRRLRGVLCEVSGVARMFCWRNSGRTYVGAAG